MMIAYLCSLESAGAAPAPSGMKFAHLFDSMYQAHWTAIWPAVVPLAVKFLISVSSFSLSVVSGTIFAAGQGLLELEPPVAVDHALDPDRRR